MADQDYKKARVLKGRFIKRGKLGRRGEAIAVSFLKKQGYKIIERNYRSKLGEIDIIAREKDNIVFVEVKTRRSDDFGLPQEAVSYRKQRRLTKIALGYLAYHRLRGMNCRFDVVGILMGRGGEVKNVELIKGAFEATY
ncbi:YraN family protein [Candidatus Aerophobetes bacterium]|uniref:UPF0102 protein DRZ78_00555 n=1 Tax=Aerophobetes bacterium TaxID=2030807 RepID=A0A662D4K9_UNCAE|nr:MAG: YraN family protein [Candidatus Aerophobetes bacterium]